jgi:hypothetical protein
VWGYCVIDGHKKGKPGYQSAKYKKSTKAAGEGNDTTPNVPTPPPLPSILPGVVDFIDSAIKAGRAIHIAYINHDPNEKRAKKVKPIEWLRYGKVFKAHCFIDDVEKPFSTRKVRKFEDQPWLVEGVVFIAISSSFCLHNVLLHRSNTTTTTINQCSASEQHHCYSLSRGRVVERDGTRSILACFQCQWL